MPHLPGRYPQGTSMHALSQLSSAIFFLALLAFPVSGVLASSATNAPATSTGDAPVAKGAPKTAEEIALESVNPLAAFYRFDYEFHYQTYQGDIAGADDQHGQYHFFQTTIPFAEKNGKGWVVQFALPYFHDQPVYWDPEGPEGHAEWLMRLEDPMGEDDWYWAPTHGHTDNVTFDLVYGGVNESGRILNYGIAGELPTTSDTSNGKQQLIIGPAVNIGKMSDWGTYGAVISHVIDVAEKEDKNTPDTSITTIQGYLGYMLGNGWQLISNPVISYDWEGDSGNKLNLPLGGGVAKTFMISKVPLRVAAELQYFVASTDRFGPDMLFKFSMSPIMPGKYTRH
jgi:hypothetical protein